ncbi:hypothetical protein PR202_ga07256 [Eleusine coracana subsp. coracana]|uniref:F-box protein AT5G49610-like beta-propeller domain-containing protein n=1 Tax=Eleusine coracana subsp. coracana TaxID=191504 RepID=A0AAV5BX05_ELECO|nr:hypothetical protein PR202_ga07256 [Eleusine coracana subsp. coracana]
MPTTSISGDDEERPPSCTIRAFGDNAEFLFLELYRRYIVYVHFKSRVVHKILSCQRADEGLEAFVSIDPGLRNGHQLVRRYRPKTQHAVVSPVHGERGAAIVLSSRRYPSPILTTTPCMCLDTDRMEQRPSSAGSTREALINLW